MTNGRSLVRSAAVYARISQDQDGKGLGVQRQLEDCRLLAAERGWVIGREYVDNDVSAYSGKVRVAYRQMVDDLAAGVRDGVIVYNLDRLHRRPVELEEFVTLCEAAGVREVATVTADIDLGNDDGLFMARIFAAFAAKESGRRSARITRKLLDNAQKGLPHGPSRAFGYELGNASIRESEAVVVRQVVARVIAGESVGSLTRWLNETGVQTVQGNAWMTSSLRHMVRSGRIAGLREHHGEVVGPAVWEAIITPAEREQVLAVFASKARANKRAPRTYVLSGLLRCGRCGRTLFSQRRYDTPGHTRRYVCKAGPDFAGSCGRLTVVADPVEQLLVDAVLARLDSPALRTALAGKTIQNPDTAALSAAIAAGTAKLEELAGLYAEDQISAREWMAARNPIEARIDRAHKDIAAVTADGPLYELLGTGESLRTQWEELSIERQHAIVATVLDHAVITPGAKGARSLDINRVQPQWRL
ncbi:recombinase family protein [Gordonia sp. CPCC 205333]|uniref:recombinase family protein n=1 Tax=Gordonia sp. CPCC 205333 TaxID=3140790 RepID=UPI003AF34E7C